MSTITLTTRELTKLVAPVIPHAGRDETLPLLASVLIRSVGTRVTALATDRYRVGLQRITPEVEPDQDFRALVPLNVLARIRSIFKSSRLHDPSLLLTVDGDTLTVATGDTFADGFTGATVQFRLRDGDYPNVDVLLRDALTSTPPTDAAVAVFNPLFLADFRLGQPNYEPIVVAPTGHPRRPWLIRVGDDFVGLLVPILRDLDARADAGLWLSLLDAPKVVAA